MISTMLNVHFDEYIAMVRVGMHARNIKMSFKKEAGNAKDAEDITFCYDVLKDVGRSFAAVIMQLHVDLRDAVCLFYLVLRALDTIEDDMDVAVEEKLNSLPTFHEHLQDLEWCMTGVGKGTEKALLEQFYRVSRECKKIKPEFQEIISDICQQMAVGMCHFLKHDVVTKDDYNLYCHYVAGLVGQGLSRLFSCSGLEDASVGRDLHRANEMGLFLQKINIIRDYHEDISESPPRIFWPIDIWSRFGSSMQDFTDPHHHSRAMECLHAMIADAVTHIPACIEYLAALKEPSVLLFSAIPQVMAIASLAVLYNNAKVFTGEEKVKIRKGLACKIIMNCGTMEGAMQQFLVHLEELDAALLEEDPSYDITKQRLAVARGAIFSHLDVKLMKLSYAKRLLVHYPTLGGKKVLSMANTLTGGYFSSTSTTTTTTTTSSEKTVDESQ